MAEVEIRPRQELYNNYQQCEEMSIATSDTRGSNYGLISDHQRGHFTSKYRNRAKMLGSVVLIVGLMAGSAAYIASSSKSQEIYRPPDQNGAKLSHSEENVVILKSRASFLQESKISSSNVEHPNAQSLTSSNASHDSNDNGTQVSSPSLPAPADSPAQTTTTTTSHSEQTVAVVNSETAVQGTTGTPMFNPKATCVNQEKLDPKTKEQLPDDAFTTKHPRNLLQEMRECPTFIFYECKKHMDRKTPLLVGWKAVVDVRSNMNEFSGYGKSKKIAIKNASAMAIAQLYKDGILPSISKTDLDIEDVIKQSICTIPQPTATPTPTR